MRIPGARLCALPRRSEGFSGLSSVSRAVSSAWVRMNLLTSLPFFSCSFSPCRRKARSPSGCALALWGPFVVGSFPSLLSTVCVCVCVHACVPVSCGSCSRCVCVHAPCLCALLQTPVEPCKDVCACVARVQCSMRVLPLVLSLTPQVLTAFLFSYFAQRVSLFYLWLPTGICCEPSLSPACVHTFVFESRSFYRLFVPLAWGLNVKVLCASEQASWLLCEHKGLQTYGVVSPHHENVPTSTGSSRC